MAPSRRTFLVHAGSLGSPAGVAARARALEAAGLDAPPAPVTAQSAPPIAVVAVRRMAFGARDGDFDRVAAMGHAAYVDQQLNPAAIDDAECDQKLAALAFESLDKSVAQLWAEYKLGASSKPSGEQTAWRLRPFHQARNATWMRAVHSKRQLLEVMVEFWHNHFNVNATSNTDIATTWPHYDRDVIRAHTLGNFRIMLEAVAKSPAMLLYLDNASNSDGGPNENYARELFELHTLGAENYLNAVYSDPDDVPKGSDGVAVGYVDVDVYEAARAFTGWTLANGRRDSAGSFPNNGEFLYWEAWHDRFQKWVLGKRIRHDQGPLVDGQQVLDLLAAHPGTAHHLCTKLCRRLVADDPPEALVQRAAAVWLANRNAPNQIALTLREILLSPEFAETWGEKVKRPFELYVSFLRGTNAGFTPNNNLHWSLLQTGYRLFEWPAPNGHPDRASAWLSSNVMLRRWNLCNSLLQTSFGAATFDIAGETKRGGATTCIEIVDYWSRRLLGHTLDATPRGALIAFLAQSGSPDAAPVPRKDAPDWGNAAAVADRLVATALLVVMSPEFQLR